MTVHQLTLARMSSQRPICAPLCQLEIGAWGRLDKSGWDQVFWYFVWFFGFFIFAKTRCLELTTHNLLTRTQSINTLVSRTWTLFLARHNRWIPSQWPYPAHEKMSWISLMSSIKILCVENIGSELPGFTFLAVHARTHAHTHTYTHAQIRTHESAHIYDYIHIHANKDTGARVCAWEK